MAKKKKNEKKIEKDINEVKMDDSIKKKILVALIVIVCIVLFYLLAVYLINNDTSSVDNMNDNADVVIDYDKILLGSSFDKGGEYYVIYYDFSDINLKNNVISIVSPYRVSKDHLRVYEVDMSSAFNKEHNINGDTNKEPNNVDELFINGITLIKFNDGRVVDYIEGIDNISNVLKVEDNNEGE